MPTAPSLELLPKRGKGQQPGRVTSQTLPIKKTVYKTRKANRKVKSETQRAEEQEKADHDGGTLSSCCHAFALMR